MFLLKLHPRHHNKSLHNELKDFVCDQCTFMTSEGMFLTQHIKVSHKNSKLYVKGKHVIKIIFDMIVVFAGPNKLYYFFRRSRVAV